MTPDPDAPGGTLVPAEPRLRRGEGSRLSPIEAAWGWLSLACLMAAVGILALLRGRSRRGAGGGWRELQTDPEALRAALEAAAQEEKRSR